jgi:hypothetical protein
LAATNGQERIVDFQISPLKIDQFSHLFGQSDEMLLEQGVQRMIADVSPGFPCRVSLQDAEVGESVLLMNYEHHSMPTPYRSSHAIYVREAASQARPKKNEIPNMLRQRLLSVRAFDKHGMMIEAEVTEGTCLELLIGRMLSNRSAEYLHIHNARPGCYAALVERG